MPSSMELRIFITRFLFRCRHFEDALSLASFVLGLGSGAQVVEPDALRDHLRSELELMLASYCPIGGVPRRK